MNKQIALMLLNETYKEEIAHLELRMIRDTQAPRFEALKDSHPEIYSDFMKARTGPHEILLEARKNRIAILTAIVEGKYDDKDKSDGSNVASCPDCKAVLRIHGGNILEFVKHKA